MRQLGRSYIFEFAGMPQSGKTAVKDILAHYLKRMEYPLEEHNGGSRYSGFPIYDMPIGELNERLAKNIESLMRFILEKQNAEHKIYLLDRGIIDRCIFTNALVQDKKISQEQAKKLYEALTVPTFLERLDGVFIFITSPETALVREYAGKLLKREDVRSQGDVMNERFLREMHFSAKQWHKEVSRRRDGYESYIKLINTTSLDTDMGEIAKDILDAISVRYPELELKLIA